MVLNYNAFVVKGQSGRIESLNYTLTRRDGQTKPGER